jgi:hypothetical protein
MRGTWHCLTAGCTIHGEGEWKAINIAAEKHGKAESHSTTVAYIYPPELGKYPPERHQPSAQQRIEALEGQVAAVRALVDALDELAAHGDIPFGIGAGWRKGVQIAAHNLRAALDPDPADRGMGDRP